MGNTGIAKCCSIFVLNWFAPASAGVPPGPGPKAFRFELPLFCPLESCSHYQKPDNTIKKDGIYRTQSDPIPRQMYYCHGGRHRFSETHYSELKHKQGSMKEYEQTAKLKTHCKITRHSSRASPISECPHANPREGIRKSRILATKRNAALYFSLA